MVASTYASYIQSGYVDNFATAVYPLLLNPSGGNVGIGTTAPNATLEVKRNTNTVNNLDSLGFDVAGIIGNAGSNPGNHYTSGIRIFQGSGSVGSGLGVFNIGVDNGTAITADQYTAHLIAPSGMTGGISLSTGGAARMRITSTGTVRMTKGGTAFSPLSYDGLVIQNGDATGIRIIDAGDGGGNGGHCGIGNDNGNLVISTAGVMMFDTGFEATDQLYSGRHTRMYIDSSGNTGIGTGTLGVANPDVTSAGVSLQVVGPVMSGRAQGFSLLAGNASKAQNIKDWFVFCGPGTNSSGNYVHMKTNLANSGANPAYTMSCFTYHSYYAYGGSTTPGGYIGWHNWSGSFYNTQLVNNGTLALVQGSYVSSDNNVVLVALVGEGYAQFSIDWHQWAGYPFRTAKVTAVSMSTSATGAY